MLFWGGRLFRKVDPCCVYCRRGTRISEREVVCVKRGVVPVEHHCRAFRYDPLKRIPPRPAVLRLGGLSQEDFSLGEAGPLLEVEGALVTDETAEAVPAAEPAEVREVDGTAEQEPETADSPPEPGDAPSVDTEPAVSAAETADNLDKPVDGVEKPENDTPKPADSAPKLADNTPKPDSAPKASGTEKKAAVPGKRFSLFRLFFK